MLPDYSTDAPGVVEAIYIGADEIRWTYEDDKPHVYPRKYFGDKRAYQTKVHPAPCYGHDIQQVTKLLTECNKRAPLCVPVTVNVLGMVEHRNTNGWAQQQWEYDDQKVTLKDGKTRARNWNGVIVLSGRNTEIHPAIANYVVPHEYAHILEDALGIIRHDEKGGDPGRSVLRDWGKARKIPAEAWDLYYGPSSHHRIPGEIFANDFRYYVMERETCWWPHSDTVPPLGKRGTLRAQRWWDKAIDELQSCYKEAKRAQAEPVDSLPS
ncbi:hypothetical protein KGP36_07130 [Patescibacteria group bacterium]|nr:hypothetical protein [Patescibacteria group bacterium]